MRMFRATVAEFWSGRVKYIPIAVLVTVVVVFAVGVSQDASGRTVLFGSPVGRTIQESRDPFDPYGGALPADVHGFCAFGILYLLNDFLVLCVMAWFAARLLHTTFQKGTLEFFMVGPHGRVALLAQRLAACFSIPAAYATAAGLAVWLTVSLKVGFAAPRFFLALPLLFLTFAALVALVFLLLTLTPKPGLVVGATIAVMLFSNIIGAVRTYLRFEEQIRGESVPRLLSASVEALYYITPNINMIPKGMAATLSGAPFPITWEAASTVCFAAGCLAAAFFLLSRRDL